MSVTITTLSENNAGYGFLGQWGLSILVETDGRRILLDTGAGFSTRYNADLLGVDLSGIDTIVISHGHYDHTGGLHDVLRRTGPIDIIAHPNIWTAKYVLIEGNARYVGIPFSRQALEGTGARFSDTTEPVWIDENIVASGEVPMITDYETVDSDLFVGENGEFRPDELADDMALAVKTDLGLVIVLGCAHRGLINTVRHFQKITGMELVRCVIGGTHLLRSSEERVLLTAAELRENGIQMLGVSHCTGFAASAILAAEFPGIFFMNNAGNRFTLD